VVPDAVVCGTIGKFVLVSLLSDQFSVQWCAIDDPTDWPTPETDDARSKQAGKETLNPEYGFVTGITGNEFYGYVFQQGAITKFTYVGGDIVFSVDTFETTRGCLGYNRFVRVGNTVFFESKFGRHSVTDGVVSDIGYGVTDDTHTPAESDNQRDVVSNIGIQTVFFQDGDLAYNYKTGQWTHLPAFNGNGYVSIEDQDAVIGQIVVNGDSIDYQISTGGVAQTAVVETGEFDLNVGGRTTISGVRPLLDKSTGTSVTVLIGERDDQSEAVTYHTLSSENSRTGKHDGRVDGRYVRTKVMITGGFDTLTGADVDHVPSGLV
jgi:hypothetical protein